MECLCGRGLGTEKEQRGLFGRKFSNVGVNRARLKLLEEVDKQDVELRLMLDDVYDREDNLITKGYKEGATIEDAKTARNLQKILNFRLAEAGKTVDRQEIADAIRQKVLSLTNEGKNLTVDEILVGIAKSNKDIKINRMNFHSHFKEELQRAILHRALGEEESIKIKFGEELNEKIETAKKSARDYAAKMNFNEEETIQAISDSIEKEINEYLDKEAADTEEIADARFEELMEQLDIDDLSHLVTRAINKEGSIQRDYTFKFDQDAYNNAIHSTLQKEENVPKSLKDLQTFARKMESELSFGERKLIVPIFGENVREELSQINNVIQGNQSPDHVYHLLSSERIEELQEELQKEKLGEEKSINRILELLTREEKEKLFRAALSVQVTQEIDSELEKFAPIIEQTIRLRELRMETADRLDIVPISSLVEDIKKASKERRTKA